MVRVRQRRLRTSRPSLLGGGRQLHRREGRGRRGYRRPGRGHRGREHPRRLTRLVGGDRHVLGQGAGGARRRARQLTAIDFASAYAWTELVSCPEGNPSGLRTSKLAHRVARELRQAGWQLERVLTDNGGEFRSGDFRRALTKRGTRHTFIRAGRPQTNGHVEALHRLILEECWRPAFARYLHVRFTGLKHDLDRYIDYYNTDRVHHGRLTRGRIPQDIVHGAHKMEAK